MRNLIVTAFILVLTTLVNAQTTKEQQAALTPDKVLADLMEGNARFVKGKIQDPEIKKRFLEKVIVQNVRQTMADIRKDSPVLTEMEAPGKIKIVGGIYDLHTGKVTLLN